MNKETNKIVWIAIIAIVIIGGGFWAYSAQQPATPGTTVDTKLLMNANSHSTDQGTRTYPVTIVEFGDYECPACGYAEPIIEKILANDPEVRLVFRNFPLQQHPFALLAAEAAEAAGAQGKFWEMHNAIYTNQDVWTTMQTPLDAFTEIAKKLGLDVNKFTQDVNSKKYADVIQKDQADGNALLVNSTPTFYINGQQYLKGLDYNTMQQTIQDALGAAATQQVAATQK